MATPVTADYLRSLFVESGDSNTVITNNSDSYNLALESFVNHIIESNYQTILTRAKSAKECYDGMRKISINIGTYMTNTYFIYNTYTFSSEEVINKLLTQLGQIFLGCSIQHDSRADTIWIIY